MLSDLVPLEGQQLDIFGYVQSQWAFFKFKYPLQPAWFHSNLININNIIKNTTYIVKIKLFI